MFSPVFSLVLSLVSSIVASLVFSLVFAPSFSLELSLVFCLAFSLVFSLVFFLVFSLVLSLVFYPSGLRLCSECVLSVFKSMEACILGRLTNKKQKFLRSPSSFSMFYDYDDYDILDSIAVPLFTNSETAAVTLLRRV